MMQKKPTPAQCCVLLQTFAANPGEGWSPDANWDPSSVAVASRLRAAALIEPMADGKPTYVLTAAGLAAATFDRVQRALAALLHVSDKEADTVGSRFCVLAGSKR